MLNLGDPGDIPADYVPDAIVRINLHARTKRLETLGEIDDLEDELEDRFGGLPVSTGRLLALARLRCLAGLSGIRQIDAGPKAIALSLPERNSNPTLKRIRKLWPDAVPKDKRVVLPCEGLNDAERLSAIERLLQDLVADA